MNDVHKITIFNNPPSLLSLLSQIFNSLPLIDDALVFGFLSKQLFCRMLGGTSFRWDTLYIKTNGELGSVSKYGCIEVTDLIVTGLLDKPTFNSVTKSKQNTVQNVKLVTLD